MVVVGVVAATAWALNLFTNHRNRAIDNQNLSQTPGADQHLKFDGFSGVTDKSYKTNIEYAMTFLDIYLIKMYQALDLTVGMIIHFKRSLSMLQSSFTVWATLVNGVSGSQKKARAGAYLQRSIGSHNEWGVSYEICCIRFLWRTYRYSTLFPMVNPDMFIHWIQKIHYFSQNLLQIKQGEIYCQYEASFTNSEEKVMSHSCFRHLVNWGAVLLSGSLLYAQNDDFLINQCLVFAQQQLANSVAEIEDVDRYPSNAPTNGSWTTTT